MSFLSIILSRSGKLFLLKLSMMILAVAILISCGVPTQPVRVSYKGAYWNACIKTGDKDNGAWMECFYIDVESLCLYTLRKPVECFDECGWREHSKECVTDGEPDGADKFDI